MAQLNFDATNVAPQASLDPIPEGWYNLAIKESEMKPTKAGDGYFVQFQIKVLDGAHVDRVIFDRVNWQNPNPVAMEIGQKRMSAYCHATGVIQLADTQQLHGIPFKGKIVIKKDATGQYEPSNEIRSIKHINDPSAQSTPAAGMPQGFTGMNPQAAPAFVQQQQPQQPTAFVPSQQTPQSFTPPVQQPQLPWSPPVQPPQQQQFAPQQQQPQLPWTPPAAPQQTPQIMQQPPQQVIPMTAGAPVDNTPPWLRK